MKLGPKKCRAQFASKSARGPICLGPICLEPSYSYKTAQMKQVRWERGVGIWLDAQLTLGKIIGIDN